MMGVFRRPATASPFAIISVAMSSSLMATSKECCPNSGWPRIPRAIISTWIRPAAHEAPWLVFVFVLLLVLDHHWRSSTSDDDDEPSRALLHANPAMKHVLLVVLLAAALAA